MKRLLLLMLIALSAAVVVGCETTPKRDPGAGYETVPDEPNRNTDLARQLQQQALLHIDAGELSAAEDLLKKSLKADVTFGPAHNNLGTVYFRQGKLYLAAWEFEYAAKLMPYVAEPRYNLGMVYENVGKLGDAIDAYKQAADVEPDNPVLLGNYARAMVKNGDHSEQLHETLTKIVMTDSRPDWVEWARSELARQGVPIAPPRSTSDKQ